MGNKSGKTRNFILVVTTERSISNKKVRLTRVKTLHSCMEKAIINYCYELDIKSRLTANYVYIRFTVISLSEK